MRISDWSSDVCSSDLLFLDLLDDLEEVGAGTVHLVDEREARNLVPGGLAPHGFGLRLHATDGAIQHAGAVEHAHGALDFDREVDVSGRIDDIDAVLVVLPSHALPERGDGSGRDRDATFLLLLHPVGRRGAVMHLAELVVDARVEQDALGDRKSTRLKLQSLMRTSYAVFCLKKKTILTH